MSQSKSHSVLETVCNTAFGFLVNFFGQMAIFPLFGYYPGVAQNLGIGACFTGLSLARGYLLRRVFNAWNSRLR